MLAQEGIPGLGFWILVLGGAISLVVLPVAGLVIWAFTRKIGRREFGETAGTGAQADARVSWE